MGMDVIGGEEVEAAVAIVVRKGVTGAARRYLFLCSPPKMVLVLRPDSRATFRKVTPRSFAGAAPADCSDAAPLERNEDNHFFGSVRASNFSRGSTSEERLSDWRNARRVEG